MWLVGHLGPWSSVFFAVAVALWLVGHLGPGSSSVFVAVALAVAVTVTMWLVGHLGFRSLSVFVAVAVAMRLVWSWGFRSLSIFVAVAVGFATLSTLWFAWLLPAVAVIFFTSIALHYHTDGGGCSWSWFWCSWRRSWFWRSWSWLWSSWRWRRFCNWSWRWCWSRRRSRLEDMSLSDGQSHISFALSVNRTARLRAQRLADWECVLAWCLMRIDRNEWQKGNECQRQKAHFPSVRFGEMNT